MGTGSDTPGLIPLGIPDMPPGYHVDGCTFWPDGNWTACCDVHDWSWAHVQDLPGVLGANINLGWCVASHGHAVMGIIMALGVSTIGLLFFVKNKIWPRTPKIRPDKST